MEVGKASLVVYGKFSTPKLFSARWREAGEYSPYSITRVANSFLSDQEVANFSRGAAATTTLASCKFFPEHWPGINTPDFGEK